jgi:hypothetical protein
VPSYARAADKLSSSVARDLDKRDQAQEMGTSYMAFLNALGPSVDASDDPLRGPVTAERIRTIHGRPHQHHSG